MILWKTTKYQHLIFLFSFLFFLFPYFSSAEKYVVDSDSLYKYAKSAFNEKDYLRSVSEFKRFIFYFPNDKRVFDAKYLICKSYLLNRNFVQCEKNTKDLIELSIKKEKEIITKDSILLKSSFLLSRCYQIQGKLQLAVNELRNITFFTENNEIKDHIFYRTALIFFNNGYFINSGKTLEKIGKYGKKRFNINKFKNIVEETKNIPEKSPLFAGMLSVIPGAGYIYTKRYRDGFVSFIFNGLLIFAAAEAFDSGNEGLGSLIAFVETGFYIGNIYGSYNSAVKYNNYMKKKYIERSLRKQSFIISLDGNNNPFIGTVIKF